MVKILHVVRIILTAIAAGSDGFNISNIIPHKLPALSVFLEIYFLISIVVLSNSCTTIFDVLIRHISILTLMLGSKLKNVIITRSNKELTMCLQCGCGLPYDDMGDANNITVADIKKSVETSDAKGLTGDEAIENIVKTWKKVKDEDKEYKA